MSIDEAKEEAEKGDYRDAVKDIKEEIESVERDFDKVKDDNASGNLKEKQKRAEDILEEIHQQMDFLQEQVERINEENENENK